MLKVVVAVWNLIFIATACASSFVERGNPNIDEYVKLNLNTKWEFQCPHVTDFESYKKVDVTWMLNKAIWLKIDNGTATIMNRLINFNRHQLGSFNVFTIVLNDFRYKFYYDEAIGEFSMTIQNAHRDDSGLWECLVNLHKQNGDIEELQTEAHVSVAGVKPWATTATTQKIAVEKIFTNAQNPSHISPHFFSTFAPSLDQQTTYERVLDEETRKGLNNTAAVKINYVFTVVTLVYFVL